MKTLFITWETYPVKSATSNCLMAIINELHNNNVEADILNITGDYLLSKEIIYGSTKVYNVFVGQYANAKKLIKQKKALALKIMAERVIERFCNRRNNIHLSNKTIHAVLHNLEKIGEKYDAFVAVCSHVLNGIICSNYCVNNGRMYILYQVDPIGTNIAYANEERMKDIELQIYNNARYIITTPILAEEKRNDPQYFEAQEKIYSCEFPNIRDLTVSEGNSIKQIPITCFYSGRFYNGVRDCRYALKVLSAIHDVEMRLVFAGDGQEEIIDEYRKNFFGDNLTHLGMISLSDSFEMMQKAGILINIGNNVTNQVPSKLFDYFSTGKPIINFCKSKDCPTIPYMEKYRLGMSIVEGEDTIERQAARVSQFIKESYGKTIDFDEIRKTFYENTPDYVGGMFVRLLKNCMNE